MEYFVLKKVRIDLVIIMNESEKEMYIENKIKDYIYSKNIAYLLNRDAGIHLINKNKILDVDYKILNACADLHFDVSKGSFEEQLEGGVKL